MVFLHGFGGAKRVLQSIKKGTCIGKCRSIWLRNIKYALKTSSNPLKLTLDQRKELKLMIKEISGKRIKTKNSLISEATKGLWPHLHRNKKIKGSDGQIYISLPNSRGTYKWKLYKKNEEKSIKKLIIKNKKLRPSPSESATKYCNKKKRGNDGKMYISKQNKNGVCRWIKL